MARVLFVSHHCYLDEANGPAVASRGLMEALARRGFATEVLCSFVLNADHEIDPLPWFAKRSGTIDAVEGALAGAEEQGARPGRAAFRLTVNGLPLTVHRGSTSQLHDPDDSERQDFLGLLESVCARFHPDILVTQGASPLIRDVLAQAHTRGITTVFLIHHFAYHDRSLFAGVGAVLVSTRFAATYYREMLGLQSTVLPYFAPLGQVCAESAATGYVTFLDQSSEDGMVVFARIAHELGSRRPDIPLLLVAGRDSKSALADCGLDQPHGTIHPLSWTPDHRTFLSLTKIGLLPSLGWKSQPRVAVEALRDGVPIVASDRGILPEVLGRAGIVLPLPERLTPATRLVPTAEEVAPWVEAIIRLWDDPEFALEHRRRALTEAQRWEPEVWELRCAQFFEGLRPVLRRRGVTT